MVQQIGFDPAREIEKEIIGTAVPVRIRTPEQPGDTISQEVHKTHRIQIRHWRRAADGNGRPPAVSALVDPKRDLAVIDIDQVCPAVSVDVPQKYPLWIIAVVKMEARVGGHVYPLAPVAAP